MSLEEIKRALQPEDDTATDSPPNTLPSASNQKQPPMTVNKTDEFSVTKVSEELSTTQVIPNQCHKDDVKQRDGTKDDPCRESEEVKGKKETAARSPSEKEDIAIHVSDVSDEEEKGKGDSKQAKESGKRKKTEHSPPRVSSQNTVLKEEFIVTSLRVAQQGQSSDKKCTKKLEESPTLQVEEERTLMKKVDVPEVLNAPSCSDSEDSTSSSGEDELDVSVSEVDATQLLEMEMRRRALESELKKFTDRDSATELKMQTSHDNSTSASEEDYAIELYVSDSETLDHVSQGPEGGRRRKAVGQQQKELPLVETASEVEVQVETETMDIGQLLEMKLRQKALQSLLNKKKQKSTQ